MKFSHFYGITLLSLLLAQNVFAEDYKSPGTMTIEERRMIADTQVNYNECLNEFAFTQLEQQTDPRVVADHAMKHCAPTLEELYTKLTESNYSPDFGKSFVSGISNRSANKLLSNLMMYMAAQGSQ